MFVLPCLTGWGAGSSRAKMVAAERQLRAICGHALKFSVLICVVLIERWGRRQKRALGRKVPQVAGSWKDGSDS